MSSEFKFPTDACVLVCSGPSLNKVDPYALGLPVVVISTAIRVITNPHFWILADHLNSMHGTEGNVAYQNENIVKIIPSNRIKKNHFDNTRNFLEIEYSSSDRTIGDIQRHLFSGKLPLLKGPHKSATFAIQWLHYAGVKTVYWVGNDMSASTAKDKYAYESTPTDLKKAHNFNNTLDQVYVKLRDWYPKAKQLGYTWYSWECGSKFETIAEKFDISEYKYPEESQYYNPVENSKNEIVDLLKTPPSSRKPREHKHRPKKREDRVRKPLVDKSAQRLQNRQREMDQAKRRQEEADKKAEIRKKRLESQTIIQQTPKSKPKSKPNNISYSKVVKISGIDNMNKRIRESLKARHK